MSPDEEKLLFDELLDELPKTAKESFNRCIEKIKQKNYLSSFNPDDAYSQAIQDMDCQKCLSMINGKFQRKIEEHIKAILNSNS